MTTQNQRNRRKGSTFELDVLRWVREEAGLPAERLRLAGKHDEGDLAIIDTGLVYVAELKAEQKIDLARYVTESQVEAANYARARGLKPADVMGIAVVKRRGKPIGDAYVVTTLREFLSP